VLFCGKDVATALGYKDTRHAISANCRYGVKHTVPHPQNPDKTIEMTFIPESDIYRLTFSSKLPNAEKFTDWITEEVIPSIMRTGSYSMDGKKKATSPNAEKRLEIQEMNARARMANMFLKLAGVETKSETYKSVLVAKAAEVLAGKQIIPLPTSEQRMYTATEVGEMFGVSAQKIGSIANKHGMKVKEFGEWYKDKSPYSSKEVDSFRYNDKAVEKFRELLGN
jgi:prophage antirepressor-like protein